MCLNVCDIATSTMRRPRPDLGCSASDKILRLLEQPVVSKSVITDSVSQTVKRQISPVTGLEWPRGFQEVKVPRFHDNGTGR